MTCAVAITDGTRTWYGSDGRTSSGNAMWARPAGKWIGLPCGLLVTCPGPLRVENLVRRIDDPSLLADELVEEIRSVVEADGWTAQEPTGDPRRWGIDGLIIGPGEVLEVFGDFAYLRSEPGVMAAAGSGYQYALGADHALRRLEPLARVTGALQAAIGNDPNCGGPVVVGELGPPGVVLGA